MERQSEGGDEQSAIHRMTGACVDARARRVEWSRGRGNGVNDRPRVILLRMNIPTPAASSTKPAIRSQGSPPWGQRGPTTAQAAASTMMIDCRTTQPSPRRPSAGGSMVKRRVKWSLRLMTEVATLTAGETRPASAAS
jgi:hypothetical protein